MMFAVGDIPHSILRVRKQLRRAFLTVFKDDDKRMSSVAECCSVQKRAQMRIRSSTFSMKVHHLPSEFKPPASLSTPSLTSGTTA